ncbi:MAG: VOC family protein [Candidatus Methylomirabilales bacterium]
MGVTFRLDHVVILVDDLAVATEDYAGLGFSVVAGGEHTGRGSHNALIAFADGSYLELIAFTDRPASPDRRVPKQIRAHELSTLPVSPAERRVRPWQSAGEGLVDFALLPSAIEAAVAEARGRGLAVEGPLSGGRSRPDGQQVSWQFGIPDTYDLPFLCADVTPRSLRVPGGAARRHGSGVTGITDVLVLVVNRDISVSRYHTLLGVGPSRDAAPRWRDVPTVDFVLGSTSLSLAEPPGKGGPLCDALNDRGEGPYALRLRTNDPARVGFLDPIRAHHARIEMALDRT